MKDKRTTADKLRTLLFGKDLRITRGDVFSTVYPFDFSSYYPEDEYIKTQEIPTENVYDIRDYGADILSADNADAINSAISAAEKTGGTVLIDGGDYVSTTVFLKSNITLFISRGSSIESNKHGKGYNFKGIIHADGCDNITITGGGKVKGNGEFFGRKPLLDENITMHPEVIDVIQMRRDNRAQLRFAHESKYGGPIYFKNCTNVKAYNFIIENAAHWSFRIENCDGVKIWDFIINNNRHVANADGFDVAGTSNLDIWHCFVSTADDGICLKNAIWLGNNKAMENIHIMNCEVISCTNSFKIGTETTFDIKNVIVEDCSFMMTDIYPGSVSGIAIESADGSVVSDIVVRNIQMERVTCPIFIRLCNRNRAKEVAAETANAVEFGKKRKKAMSAEKERFDMLGEVKNITIENVTAYGVEVPCIIAGFTQNKITKYVYNVILRNIDLNYAPYKEVYDKRSYIPEYSDVYPEAWRFRNLPAYGIWARHVKGLKLLDFKCSTPRSTWKEQFVMEDVR
ncbi:MAG: glycoside hydrolase family 28 protein [Eubacterium sp.]